MNLTTLIPTTFNNIHLLRSLMGDGMVPTPAGISTYMKVPAEIRSVCTENFVLMVIQPVERAHVHFQLGDAGLLEVHKKWDSFSPAQKSLINDLCGVIANMAEKGLL